MTFGAPQRHGDRYRRACARDLRRAIAAMRQVRRRVFAGAKATLAASGGGRPRGLAAAR